MRRIARFAALATLGLLLTAQAAPPNDITASLPPLRLGPDDVRRIMHAALTADCMPVRLGDLAVSGPLPLEILAMQATGIVAISALRTGLDGAVLHRIALAENADREQLRITGEGVCVPQIRHVEIKLPKTFSVLKGGAGGWDAVLIEAEYTAQRSELAQRLLRALMAKEAAVDHRARFLLRYDATAKGWRVVAFDVAVADKSYATGHVWRALAVD